MVAGITPAELEVLSAESGFSRFPVVDDERRIIGYLHVKDALDASPRTEPFKVEDMRSIANVKENTPWTTSSPRCAAAVRISLRYSTRRGG